jgi:hypothetical protein
LFPVAAPSVWYAGRGRPYGFGVFDDFFDLVSVLAADLEGLVSTRYDTYKVCFYALFREPVFTRQGRRRPHTVVRSITIRASQESKTKKSTRLNLKPELNAGRKWTFGINPRP